MAFTHLHTHSHFSLLEGVPAPGVLVARARQFKMTSLALTDHNALYGAVEFYQACQAGAIQPLIGLELDTDDGDRLVLLARDRDGYRRLCRLSSAVQLSQPHAGRRTGCGMELLRAESSGLIVLSGGHRSLIPRLVRAGKLHRAARLIGAYASIFGADNFFLELVIHDPDDANTVFDLVRLGNDLGVPCVVTNDTLGATPEDSNTAHLLDAVRTHTTLVAPHEDKAAHAARYLKSPAQMEQLFADYPEALANTRFIARRCDLSLPLGTLRFPSVALDAGETPFSQLYKLAFHGATERYQPLRADVTARLQYELQCIEDAGFAAYFLIVYNIAQAARQLGIPIFGRGSAADSLVSYVLGLTAVDPIAHGLYFERFLNPERADPPDIDLDICWRRRDEVISWVYETYGAERVAMLGTHVCFKLRSAWRDVARAHGLPAEGIAALAGRPWHDVDEAQAETGAAGPPAEDADPDLEAEGDPAWGPVYPPGAETETGDPPEAPLPPLDPAVLEGCAALDGRPRHVGIHCGGVLVAPFPLTDEVPLQRATKGLAISQYDMHAVAALGLLKIDLLGSRALSALHACAARVRLNGGALDLERIPWDDAATYALLAAGGTLGCFQLESPGMRAMLRTMQPRRFDDIIAAVSLFRPGPLEGGLKDTFLERLRAGVPLTYLHPALEPVLAETQGVILYQEQFLRLVHDVAGFSLGEAERLRKLLGKVAGPAERATLRAGFLAGAIGNDIPQPLAEQIWDTLVLYSGFGFCKGHAASYAVIAYRTAYCKAHYPAELLAAVLDNRAGFYPAQVYIEEARRLGLQLLGPDVNRSAAGTSARDRAVRLGLHAVQGVRRDVVAALIAARRAGGTFVSLRDLLTRVTLSKEEITTLIQVGALDRIAEGRGRPELLWQARLWLPALNAARARGQQPEQSRLPLLEPWPDLPPTMPPLRPYSPAELLELEQGALGFTLTANPLAPYAALLRRHGVVPAGDLVAHAGDSAVVSGIPVTVRRHLAHGGGWMLFLTIQDPQDLIEVVVGPDAYAAALPALAAGGPLLVRGQVEVARHGGAIMRGHKFRPLLAPRGGTAVPAPAAPEPMTHPARPLEVPGAVAE